MTLWGLIRKLFPQRPAVGNGSAAKRALKASDRRLEQAKRRWPETEEARDILAEWIERALRGNG